MREQAQCSNCDLVQFRTKRNACRRCRAPLPMRRLTPDLKPDPPPPEAPELITVPPPPRSDRPIGIIIPLDEVIQRAVLDAMDKCEGNVLLAARYLKVGKTTVYRYLREWGWASPYSRERFGS